MKVMLKLKKRHPNNAFRVQETIVDSYTFKEYDVSKAAYAELKSEGVKHWVEMQDPKDEVKKAAEAAKAKAEKERLEAEAAAAEAEAKAKELEGLNGSN